MAEIPTKREHLIEDGKCTRCGCSKAYIERFAPTCDEPRSGAIAAKNSRGNGPRCPKCRSTSVTANKMGFGLGKAVAGGVALGTVGLLSGFLGSRKVYVTCLQCGHSWKAGTVPVAKQPRGLITRR